MRPESLFPYFALITSLPGIGPRIGKYIEKLAGGHIVDLLWHLPRDIIDRQYCPKIIDAEIGRIATLNVKIIKHHPTNDRKRPYRITCGDDTGEITLIFFRGDKKWFLNQMPEGEMRIISGRLDSYNDIKQMPHPDYILPIERIDEMPKIEAVYQLMAGVTPKTLYKAINSSLRRVKKLPEWQDSDYITQQKWQPWHLSLLTTHKPQNIMDISSDNPARQRLAFDELLANQLALAIMRQQVKKQSGIIINGDGKLRQKILNSLPFELTKCQKRSLDEIYQDMKQPSRMLRLLQGDVGSGKTIVALLAMLNAIECDGQAALMAPTEILAKQHFKTIAPLCDVIDINVGLLTGRDKGKRRDKILTDLSNGKISILIGTHALFQADIRFKALTLAIIDEQHRFGVQQRLALAKKGNGVDMLVMTATPIPRTLMMSAYGDLDDSRLVQKPAGRKEIETIVINNNRLDEVINAVERKITQGAKIYWVCPLVEESDQLDLAAAEARHRQLSNHFKKDKVALIHGRMKAKEKDAAMKSFSDGNVNLLVATTVIEVGVDVPSATVMVIEHAERFGLAQLHQLRGRIGRGVVQSTCILLRSEKLTDTARERLKILSKSNDGFLIAEKDLELRGAGEVLGTRQSGLPHMRLADFAIHGDLIKAAADDAKLILLKDPKLTSERGKALRILLYLFERDSAIANLQSG